MWTHIQQLLGKTSFHPPHGGATPSPFVFIILRPELYCHIVIINYNFSLSLTNVELSRNETQADPIYFQTLWLTSRPPYLGAMTRRSPPEAAQNLSTQVNKLPFSVGSSNVSAWITSSHVPASLFVGGRCFPSWLTETTAAANLVPAAECKNNDAAFWMQKNKANKQISQGPLLFGLISI